MNEVNKKTNKIKQSIWKKKAIIIAVTISMLVAVAMLVFSIGRKQMSGFFNIVNKYVDEQTDGELTEGQTLEITKTIQGIMEENETCHGLELNERVNSIKEELQKELKDVSYLTEEEKDSIINNLDKFIQNEYKADIRKINDKLSGFEELFNEIEIRIFKKADNDTVNEIKEKTVIMIKVDEQLKKTDIDLYNQILDLNNRLSKLNNSQNNFSKEMNTRIDNAVNEFNILLNEIKSDTTKDYTEKLGELRTKVEQYVININQCIMDMNVTMEESNKQINNSISNLKDETNSSMENLDNKTNTSITEVKNNADVAISNLKSYVTNMISELKSTLEEQIYQNSLGILGLNDAVRINQDSIGKINTIVTDNSKSIQDMNVGVLENKSMISDMKMQLNDCFQSVSNGKALLASTLTDKGIDTVSDASFGEINNNILNLYTAAFTAGVDSVSGINADVEYEYHYHEGSVTEGGGCYNIENRHYHTGSSTNGGGCYTSPNYSISYIYPSCSGSWIKDTDSWGDKDGNRDRRYRGWCSVCGYYCASYSEWNRYPSEAGPSHTSLKATEIKKLSGYSLGCGHEDGELLGFETSCGMIDGQIVSAKINMNNAKTKNTNILTSLTSLFNMEIEAEEKAVMEENKIEETVDTKDASNEAVDDNYEGENEEEALDDNHEGGNEEEAVDNNHEGGSEEVATESCYENKVEVSNIDVTGSEESSTEIIEEKLIE